MLDESIAIAVAGGKGFVWSVQDARRLREQHHICGLNSGTLPQVAQQNVFLGLPLQLLPEEVVLLVEERIAYLIDESAAHRQATSEQAQQYADQRQLDIVRQQEEQARLIQEKRAHVEDVYAAEIARRRQEKAAKVGQNVQSNEVHQPSQTENPEKSRQDQSTLSYTIHIEGASNNLPWYEPMSNAYRDLAKAREAGLWVYPVTALQRAKCAVYKDLWKRGYFMGGGLKFGGDFLVYKGDPLRYHSHFSTTVYASPLADIDAMEFVACGRLATAVKKAHLLCGYDENNGTVDYYSLEWSGMG